VLATSSGGPTASDDEDEEADVFSESTGGDFVWNLSPWTSDLRRTYGGKLLWMLWAAQHVIKGFAAPFIHQPERFIYRDYHVSGPQLQIFAGVSNLPWALKPMTGMVSDMVPINGFNKSPYIVLASLGGVISLAFLALLPQDAIRVEVVVMLSGPKQCSFSGKKIIILTEHQCSFSLMIMEIEKNEHCDLGPLVMLFFFLANQRAVVDLLTEAKYAEAMREKPKSAPDLVVPTF